MSNPQRGLGCKCRMRLFFHLPIIFLASSGQLVSSAQAQGQGPCENVVTEAQKLYEGRQLSPAIRLLRLCLPDGVPEEQRVSAYRLLALAYLAEGEPEEAKEVITKIVRQKRDYACDPAQDPQTYCDLVERVKATLPETTCEKLFGGQKKWFWVAGGVVGVVAAILIAKGNDGTPEQPLPEPPLP